MAQTNASSVLKIGLAQVAPVLLNREATLAKIIEHVRAAAGHGCRLVAFGEALVPGYPFWIERTDGARFNAADQKTLHARYATQAVQPESGHLAELCEAAHDGGIAVILGTIERAADRGGHSLYCSRVYIESDGTVASIHRKLMPTYEERLTWAIGDGAGLVVHRLGPFTVGALNCWENWMPLARTALYAEGEDLHVALWPGTNLNTTDITRFIARESRSYVCSVSGLIREQDVPADVPYRDRIVPEPGEVVCNGGTAVAGPDGEWIVEPVTDREDLIVVEIDHQRVLEERQNFDPSGHYARPDVLRLTVDRTRQRSVDWIDATPRTRPEGS
jgi:nitrilase